MQLSALTAAVSSSLLWLRWASCLVAALEPEVARWRFPVEADSVSGLVRAGGATISQSDSRRLDGCACDKPFGGADLCGCGTAGGQRNFWGRRVAPKQVIARHLDFVRPANKCPPAQPLLMFDTIRSS